MTVDLFSCPSLSFDHSLKKFIFDSQEDSVLNLKNVEFEYPSFEKTDENNTSDKSYITYFFFSKSHFDLGLFVFENGIAVYDLSELVKSSKSLISEKMIINWPTNLIESILKIKKDKKELFYSESTRQKIKSSIDKKIDLDKFKNPKFNALYINKNKLKIHQIELLKENEEYAFGQISQFYSVLEFEKIILENCFLSASFSFNFMFIFNKNFDCAYLFYIKNLYDKNNLKINLMTQFIFLTQFENIIDIQFHFRKDE